MTDHERLSVLLSGIERAEQHVHDLHTEIGSFLRREPYVVRSYLDSKVRQRVCEISQAAPVPPACARMLGDAIFVLRSTLNRLAYQLFEAANPGKNGWHIQYPIADSANEYPSMRDGKIEGLPRHVIAALDATKPYMGGNNGLWGIDYLYRVDQRCPIRLVGVCTNLLLRSRDRHAGLAPIGHSLRAQFFLDRPACALEPGHELLRLPCETETHDDIKFTFDVAIGEFKVPLAYSVVETLQGMTDLVKDLIGDFRPYLD